MSQKPVRCVIFCMLLLYATTADFMTTSLFADGHATHHSRVRIEHKCVTELAGVKQGHQDLSSIAATSHMIAVAVVARPTTHPAPRVYEMVARFATASELASVRHSAAPLRC